MRIAHVSDTHLGYWNGKARDGDGRNLRQTDFERSWMDACRQISDLEPDIVVHTGDAFHMVRPPYRSIRAFVDGLRLLGETPVVVLGGNHDTSRIPSTTSVFTLVAPAASALSRFVVGYDDQRLDLGGAIVHCVPWGRLVRVSPYDFQFSKGRRHVLLAHGDVPTGAFASTEAGGGSVGEATLELPWDLVLMGHIHQRHQAGYAYYAGSTERCGWSDFEATPSFTIHDLSAQTREIFEVEHRPFFDAGETEWVDEAILRSFLEETANAHKDEVVRVTVTGVERRKVGTIHGMASRAHGMMSVRVKTDDGATSLWSPNQRMEALSVQDAFTSFVASREAPEEFKRVFMARGLEAISEAERAIHAEEVGE